MIKRKNELQKLARRMKAKGKKNVLSTLTKIIEKKVKKNLTFDQTCAIL